MLPWSEWTVYFMILGARNLSNTRSAIRMAAILAFSISAEINFIFPWLPFPFYFNTILVKGDGALAILRDNTTHVMMPGDIGYIKSINNIKARQHGMCHFCTKEITAGKDIIVSKLGSKTRYYHLECASRLLII